VEGTFWKQESLLRIPIPHPQSRLSEKDMKQIQDAYIVAATRTPVGKAPRGVFRNTRPDDMLAHVLRSVVAQAPGIDLTRIEDAVIGCAMPEGEQGMNVARIGVLLAGLPDTVAAQTINRFCSSGLQAVALAASEIRLGNADLVLAGGTESMSMVPMMGNKVALSPSVFEDDHVAIAYGMGITAEKVAEEWKVSRDEQDAFALASHQKAIAAINAGEFKDEISPYEVMSHVPDLSGNTVQLKKRLVDTDEGPRPDTSLDGLARLRPVFRNAQFGGSVTAGNSSQMSDGAAAVLLASEQAVKDQLLGGRGASGSHGHRADRCDPQGTQAGRPESRSARLDRTQRGIRRAGAGRDQGLSARSGQGQPAGRRDRTGPSARCHRRGAHRDGRARAAQAQAEVRDGDHVHWYGHGRRWDF
jgi:acetyl-CoA acetyltransferase family protein